MDYWCPLPFFVLRALASRERDRTALLRLLEVSACHVYDKDFEFLVQGKDRAISGYGDFLQRSEERQMCQVWTRILRSRLQDHRQLRDGVSTRATDLLGKISRVPQIRDGCRGAIRD